MKKSARQSMAWLHSWLGLLLGWLLFCIFLTGTMAYYRQEINLWSQPALANIQVNQKIAIQQTFQYLQEHAKDAQSWFIQVATDESPVNNIFWQKPDGSYASKTLDPNTGKELILAPTPIGNFFYNFHFQLFGIPYYVGRLIVSFAAFIMLLSLISGIITHKKIFTDFFTFRKLKGPRSYLDFHNISSVIALPFFLTISFTGLAIFFYLYFPLGIQQLYPKNSLQYFEEITKHTSTSQTNLTSTPMLDIQRIQSSIPPYFNHAKINSINVKYPNTPSATITFVTAQNSSITRNAPQVTINAVTGAILEDTQNTSPIAILNSGVYGLHMAKFAQPALRLTLFFSGILGCFMIASGLLLWSLKRQIQHPSTKLHLGYFLVNRFNVSTILSLPIAIIGCFLSNRISLILNTQNYDVMAFSIVWLYCFLFSLIIKGQYLWPLFLKVLICFCGLLIIIDGLYLTHFLHFDELKTYWKFIRFDLIILFLLCFAIYLHRHIEPIRTKSLSKMKAKYEVT